MLYQYALTPDAFEASAVNNMNPPGVVLTQLLRGMCENGLLANLNAGRWIAEVLRAQQNAAFPPSVRDRVESCLKLLHDRNRLVLHPRGSVDHDGDEFRWIKWSLERHYAYADNPLKGIFCSDDYAELSEIIDHALVPLSVALDSDCWIDRKRSVDFAKTESSLLRHLIPVVRNAQKVSLIDPFMTCREDRFFNTVQHCARHLGTGCGKQTSGVIHIHAGDPTSVGPDGHREPVIRRLERWRIGLEDVSRMWNHTYRVFLWGKRGGGRPFHDRFIVTNQCGVKAPGGLDFLPDSEEPKAMLSSWELVEPQVVEQLVLEQFHCTKSPYLYLDSCEVRPSI